MFEVYCYKYYKTSILPYAHTHKHTIFPVERVCDNFKKHFYMALLAWLGHKIANWNAPITTESPARWLLPSRHVQYSQPADQIRAEHTSSPIQHGPWSPPFSKSGSRGSSRGASGVDGKLPCWGRVMRSVCGTAVEAEGRRSTSSAWRKHSFERDVERKWMEERGQAHTTSSSQSLLLFPSLALGATSRSQLNAQLFSQELSLRSGNNLYFLIITC